MAHKQISPQPVVEGGIGVSSNTAYTVLCGGTTSTGAIQSIASVGTADQALTSNGASALPSFADLGSGTLGTVAATTSGTTVTYSGFPSSTTLIVFGINNVSGSLSTGNFLLQLGDSGGIETTGYSGTMWDGSTANVWSSGATIISAATMDATKTYVARIEISLYDAATYTWIISVQSVSSSTAVSAFGVGKKALSDVLTQIQLSVTTGAFDAGSVNVLYYS
tara:strand:+ start:188 stop:853 length:666 start_codon:yes stop_codon:yes gene_type:complete